MDYLPLLDLLFRITSNCRTEADEARIRDDKDDWFTF